MDKPFIKIKYCNEKNTCDVCGNKTFLSIEHKTISMDEVKNLNLCDKCFTALLESIDEKRIDLVEELVQNRSAFQKESAMFYRPSEPDLGEEVERLESKVSDLEDDVSRLEDENNDLRNRLSQYE